jgi:hypothetical protein
MDNGKVFRPLVVHAAGGRSRPRHGGPSNGIQPIALFKQGSVSAADPRNKSSRLVHDPDYLAELHGAAFTPTPLHFALPFAGKGWRLMSGS